MVILMSNRTRGGGWILGKFKHILTQYVDFRDSLVLHPSAFSTTSIALGVGTRQEFTEISAKTLAGEKESNLSDKSEGGEKLDSDPHF